MAPRYVAVTSVELSRALEASNAEYAIFWRSSGGRTGTLTAEAWLALDGSLMEPDIGRIYQAGSGDVGSVYTAKSTRLMRNVCACDIKTFARLQLACYYRIQTVCLSYVRHGEIRGILELGTTKEDWAEAPRLVLFDAEAQPPADGASAPAAVSREQLQAVLASTGASYAIFWQQIGRALELKGTCWCAADEVCMRRSLTFSCDQGSIVERAWRAREPALLPDASGLDARAFPRAPLILHHKIRSIALVPVGAGVVEFGTEGTWTAIPPLPDALLAAHARGPAAAPAGEPPEPRAAVAPLPGEAAARALPPSGAGGVGQGPRASERRSPSKLVLSLPPALAGGVGQAVVVVTAEDAYEAPLFGAMPVTAAAGAWESPAVAAGEVSP